MSPIVTLSPTLSVADDPPRQQPGDLHGDHLDAVGGADHDAVAFVVGAGGGEVGGPNSPGRCSTATTSPLIGARCTCASNTDRKMLMRGNGVAGKPSSAGGSRFLDDADRARPPGRRLRPGRVGGTRGGCRKNAAWATAEASPARRSHCVAVACRGDREADPDERKALGVHRRYCGTHQRHESRGA